MAGNAKTSKFMLSTATVMIGPMADLHRLEPQKHSIGLVKNFQFTGEPQMTELTQGIKNAVVMSVKTSEGLRTSCEVYEFTPQNLAYASGLDGSQTKFEIAQELSALSAEAAPEGTDLTLATDLTDPLVAGDYLFVQKGQDDYVHIVKVASYDDITSTVTIVAGFEIPAGMTFPIGSRVGKLVRVDVGGNTAQPEFACKVVGLLPKDNSPFTILFPKVKITRGLGVSFAADNFTNMPFEMTPYQQVMNDPFYDEYGDGQAILFAR